MKFIRFVFQIFISFLPWPIRRVVLCQVFGYKILPSARISPFSWVYPEQLTMREGARIGPLTVAIHLDSIEMGSFATIGRGNWITGHPKKSVAHFVHCVDRNSCLKMGDHSAITKSHIIDCTDSVLIGAFTTVAGYGSQFITHGIDYQTNRQDCRPISIGSYCLLGTRIVAVGGAVLPDYTVLGAGAVLTGKNVGSWHVYAGVPAKPVKEISKDAAYFSRSNGFVK